MSLSINSVNSSLARRTPRLRAVFNILAAASVAALAACAPSTASPPPGTGFDVVTTTTVFADLVRNVGGEHVRAVSLVPAGGDVHTYAPRPEDIRTVSGAKLFVMNGLGLDDWLAETITSANNTAPLVKLAVDLPGVQLLPGEEPGTQNPHLWMDVKYAQLYVDRIAEALEQVDPQHAADYAANQAAYRAQLDTLDAWVREQVATIPQQDRKLVTFHDAFPYFAREYGIEVVGVAVEAPGQDPSAAQIGQLVQAIKASGAKAIFSEDQFPTKLVDQLAAEAGVAVVANLYDDSVGDPPVTSYDAVIRWDVQALVDALGG
ncbi:MAG: manganese/iron transport system substrate-binding protein [Chloroflexota bacterium]|jgi:ABC-type Zn uptake system ZnuABC Zn-binding protein ZnuA|nr:manganese/iron transport system substrate-binding protein [Chloroflexota bacterium]